MKMIKTAMLAIAMALPLAAPVAAQEFPLVPGEYVQMSGIDVKDGAGGLKYAEFLATEWKKNQEYAKSQKWITDYGIYTNVDKRPGEPDIYLMIRFASIPDAAEQQRRAKAYEAWSRTTVQDQAVASGNRAEYRTSVSSMLLQEYKPR